MTAHTDRTRRIRTIGPVESPDFLEASGSSPPLLPIRLLTADISDRAKLLYVHLYARVQIDYEFLVRTGLCEPNGWQVEGHDYRSLGIHLHWTEPEIKQAVRELVEAGYLVVDEKTGSYDVDGETCSWSWIRFGLTTKGVVRTPEEWKPGESVISTGFVSVSGGQS